MHGRPAIGSESAIVVYQHEKDFCAGQNIALRYFTMDSPNCGQPLFWQRTWVPWTDWNSAEAYFYKGAIGYKATKDYVAWVLLKSVQLDKTRKEAFEKIGDLYMDSFRRCAKLERQTDDRQST